MTDTWTPVDRARPATSAALTRLQGAAAKLTGLALAGEGIAHEMRLCMIERPHADEPWCFQHERPIRLCHLDAMLCDGEYVQEHPDPTGEAAISRDRARDAHAEFLRVSERVARDVDRLEEIAFLYPANAERPQTVGTDLLGPEWCTSCHRDNDYCEPVGLRPDGKTARRAGLCRWCGDWLTAHKHQPPLHLVELRHRGVRITQGMVDEATGQYRKRDAERTKARKARKGKRGNGARLTADERAEL